MSTRLASSTLLMLPTNSQSTAKRKLPDDSSNPLLNAAKKARKDQVKVVASGSKRKLNNGDDHAGGLIIVQAADPILRSSTEQSHVSSSSSSRPASQPPPDRPLSRPPSSNSQKRPLTSTSSLPHPHPAKKFRADSQPPSSQPQASTSRAHLPKLPVATNGDVPRSAPESSVAEDEADRFRRESRARMTIQPSLMQESQLSARPTDGRSVAGASNSRSKKTTVIDTQLAMPSAHTESPMIAKNKLLREGAMAAIRSDSQEQEETRGRRLSNVDTGKGHRRRSSINGRGKRISASFEATGVIPQPHNSVSDSSFYKHIDLELPVAERLRQLLIWCSSRAAQAVDPSSSPPDLPPLSDKEVLVFRKVQDEIQRMLAERKIDTNPHTSPSEASGSDRQIQKKENEQNVSNRKFEKTYTEQIHKMEEEHEAWKKVNDFYESYHKKEQARLEKRKVEISQLQAKSAKAKGKQKASEENGIGVPEEDWTWMPSEHLLNEPLRSGLELARSVMGLRPSTLSRAESASWTLGSVRIGKESSEAKLKEKFSELEFNLDTLHTHVNAARATTNVAEAALDQRYRILSMALAARSGDVPSKTGIGGRPDLASSSGTATQVIGSYISEGATGMGPDDAQDLFRALARVDSERPPAQVGDAARRAAREVQRMEQSGTASGSGRRLTEVPQTPRKMPGTPRRGNTPGRGTTPGR